MPSRIIEIESMKLPIQSRRIQFNETLIGLVYRRCTCGLWNDNCYYLKHLEDLEICLYIDFTSEKDQIYQFCSGYIHLLAFPYLMIMLVVNIYYLY